MNYAISIDIGGTNTRVSLISNTYEIVSYESFATNPIDPLVTMDQIGDVISRFDQDAIGIGVSCPGPADLKRGVILTPPNLPGWHGFKLVETMEKKFGLKTYLENDANLAGLAEATLGAGKGFDYVQYLTVSTGLGGGFIVNGEIYQGSKGFALEVANVIVKPGGFKLNDLKPGSVESLSSGTGIVARAKEEGIVVQHAGEVNDLANAGNEVCQKIMDEAKDGLSNLIAMLYGVLDPEVIVLGGSVALKTDGFVADIETLVKEKVYEVVSPNVRLKKASLGDDNGVLGGAILAFNRNEVEHGNS